MFTEIQEQQILVQINEILSAVRTTALGVREVHPKALYVQGPNSGVIPDNTKAFNIINLGLNGLNVTFADVAVTGITGITEILAALKVFGYSIENDQNQIQGPITVTPANNHIVLLQYLS